MPDVDLPFSRAEYAQRLERTHAAMEARGIDVLFTCDPSNMAWLTGYDGWSFYVHQGVIVPAGDVPIWWGRQMDAYGAMRTVYLPESRIVPYHDDFVMSRERHPMQHLAAELRSRGLDKGRIGVEMENYYFSAAAWQTLTRECGDATFVDATALVNWQRLVKSEAELAFMRRAATIVERMHECIRERIEPGMRKNELVADIYATAIRGTDEFGGDYPAIVPLLPSGADASAAHLTWDDRPFQHGAATFFELAGCYRRYHAPLSRTVYLGTPPRAVRDAERTVLEGIEAGLDAARAGNRACDIANAFHDTLARAGIDRQGRCGYSIGLSYPPDWGERTLSLRASDTTELVPDMTLHFMPALWLEDWGLELTETIRIVPGGPPETLASVSRELYVKD